LQPILLPICCLTFPSGQWPPYVIPS